MTQYSRLVGRTVVDAAGQPLGTLAGTYVDIDSGEVLFGAVSMVRRGRRKRVMVCLVGATVSDDAVSVTCGRELARRGPSVRPGEELTALQEPELFAHYDLLYRVDDEHDRRLSPGETG